jgi:hypothetical protein
VKRLRTAGFVWVVLAVWLALAAAWVAVVAGLIWAAFHFIWKYW